MDGKIYDVTHNYSWGAKDLMGRLQLSGNASEEAVLAECVIAPEVIVHKDGTREITSWSVVLGSHYDPQALDRLEAKS